MALIASASASAEEKALQTLTSPDGKNSVSVCQETSDGTIYYRMARNGKTLIGNSSLGMATGDGDFTKNLTFTGATTTTVNETYPMLTGKASIIENHCNEATLSFTASNGQKMDVVFRNYDDGVAFRYVFKGTSKSNFVVNSDNSQINIPSFQRCWGQKWTYDYSQGYVSLDWEGAKAIKPDGDDRLGNGTFAAPLLVESSMGDDCYLLLTDAGVDKNFSRAPLKASEGTGCFSFFLRGTKNNGLAVTTVRPLSTPWRCAIVGKLTDIAVSNLCTNVSDATVNDPSGKNWSWVKPGYSSWDWGGEQGGGLKNRTDNTLAKEYIDFAVYMGWQYFTLDEGWESSSLNGSKDDYVKDICAYAKKKGIGVFLWASSGSFSGGLSGYRTRLKKFKEYGAVGAKIDFFYDGDTKGVMQKQEELLQAAAENQIMVNFHGCPTPTGLNRKWPNEVAVEAVDGNEDYFTGGWNNTGTDPGYNGMLVLMRNVVGPIDYTICEFRTGTDGKGTMRDNTTVAHQLAHMATMECGVQYIADAPKNIKGQKWENALKDVPAAWDESICLEATIGSDGTAKDLQDNADINCNLTMARRYRNKWFVGRTVNNPSTYQLDCSFLGEGTYRAVIWRDQSANTRADVLTSETRDNITKDSMISINCYLYGGFFVRFDRTDVDDYVSSDWNVAGNKYDAEDATFVNGSPDGELATNKDPLASGGNTVKNVGNGNWLEYVYGSPYEGDYTIETYYVCDADRQLSVSVNGGAASTVDCPSTGSLKARNGEKSVTFNVHLKAGRNVIRIGGDAASPYLDYVIIKFQKQTTGVDIPPSASAAAHNEDVYDLSGRKVSRKGLGNLPANVYIYKGHKVLKK